jgi:hypothetical protein
MNLEYKHKTIALKITINDNKTACATVHDDPGFKGDNVLPLHYSLLGEVAPTLAPLAIDNSLNSHTAYRYDWVVGLGEPPTPWEWRQLMRPVRALTVQLVVDCRGTGLTFSDAAPMLLALHPSLETTSWFDRHADDTREVVKETAKLAEPYTFGLSAVAGVAANYISSGKGKDKNWFMYRFFETGLRSTVIEWNIKKDTLWEYGPLLRGSIVLSFHGAPQENDSIRLLLRPRLGFDNSKTRGSDISFVPDLKYLEDAPATPVALTVRPHMPQ